MDPISEATFDPTLPESIRHIIVDENSRRIISRETTPTVNRGSMGESIFIAICKTITAPIKNDMIITIQIELTPRSEEHTSELQSRPHLVCRLLLEKKK